MIDTDTFKAVAKSKSVSESTGAILAKTTKFYACAIDAGLNVQDNKQGLTQGTGALVTNGNVRVFKAAELDLDRYSAFALALAPCFTPAGCQPTTIEGFFQNYLKDSEALILDQVKATFTPWSTSLDGVANSFSSLSANTKSIADMTTSIQAASTKIVNDFCPDANVCASNTLTEFKKQVESTLDISKQVGEVYDLAKGTVQDAKDLSDLISSTVSFFENLNDLQIETIVVNFITSGGKSLDELAKSLKVAQRLPNILNSLEAKLPNLQKTIASIVVKGPQFVDSLQGIFTRNWLSDYQGDAATASKIGDQVFAVQKLFEQLIPQATELYSSVTFLANSLGSVEKTGQIGKVDVAVASYQRWTKGSFAMPCLTTGKITFSILSFKTVVDYPKFYRCVQEYNIPFPNQHIPYVRLTLPQDSTLAKLGQDTKGATTSITWSGAKPSANGQANSSVASAASSSFSSSASVVSSSAGISPSEAASSATVTSSADISPSETSASTTVTSSADTSPLEAAPSAAISSSSDSSSSDATPSVVVSSSTATPEDISSSLTTASTFNSPPAIDTTRRRAARRRAIPYDRRQEGAEDEDDPVPVDIDITLAAPALSGYATDSTMLSVPTTSVAYSEVVEGDTTRSVEIPVPTNIQITAIETAAEPGPTSITLASETYNIYSDVTETELETVMSSWSALGTVSVDMATPTEEIDSGGQSAIASSSSASAFATATASNAAGKSKGGAWGEAGVSLVVMGTIGGIAFEAIWL